MSLSVAAANGIVDGLCNAAGFAVTTPKAGLHTGDPGTTGANEVVGGSYVKQAISFGAAAAGSAANDTLVEFPDMPGGPTTVTHFSLNDDATFVLGGALTASVQFNGGETARFQVGTFTVSAA